MASERILLLGFAARLFGRLSSERVLFRALEASRQLRPGHSVALNIGDRHNRIVECCPNMSNTRLDILADLFLSS